MYSRAGTPGTPARGPRDSHARAHTHTHTHIHTQKLSVRPSLPGLGPGPLGPSGRRGGLGSALTLGGLGPQVGSPHVCGPPLLGGAGGRSSWANTESSPEELELGVSWPPGEYCSKGTDRSRYSCGWAVVSTERPQPQPQPPGACRGPTHIGGRHSEDAVQVLHQLLEGGPLRRHSMPALPHDHVPADGGVRRLSAARHAQPVPVSPALRTSLVGRWALTLPRVRD